MAMAYEIIEAELKKHISETNASIQNHRDNDEEEWNNGFMLEDHVLIQKDSAEKKAKEEEERAKETEESDDEMGAPFVLDPNTKSIRCLANESLKAYNRRKGAKYKLKRVLKANLYICAGYTITFTAEECSTNHKPDEPPLKYLLDWSDDKVFYDSADDTPSDKLFVVEVDRRRDGSIKVGRCVMRKEGEKYNTEELEEDYDSEDEFINGLYKKQAVIQVLSLFLLLAGCYLLS